MFLRKLTCFTSTTITSNTASEEESDDCFNFGKCFPKIYKNNVVIHLFYFSFDENVWLQFKWPNHLIKLFKLISVKLYIKKLFR